mmetsp:Transcript_50803/g.162578  ORF Transcript_50803/g.162578 Transcript_50803/m.162578 type:complete len:116 (+) Transcript_50803:422-769(+)
MLVGIKTSFQRVLPTERQWAEPEGYQGFMRTIRAQQRRSNGNAHVKNPARLTSPRGAAIQKVEDRGLHSDSGSSREVGRGVQRFCLRTTFELQRGLAGLAQLDQIVAGADNVVRE